jgi:hypothetical protein
MRRNAFMTLAGDEGHWATVILFRRLYSGIAQANQAPPISDFGIYEEALRSAHRKVRSDQWVDTLPDLTEHLAAYRSNIFALKKFADSRGKPILFVTQPFLWSPVMTAEAKSQIYAGFIGPSMGPEAKWYTTSALEHGLTAYNQALLETCRSGHLLCVDAAGQIPKLPEYFIDDFHFSGAGAAKIGGVVAKAVEGETPLCN